jgi:two-component system phosphate regulon sensor histidine kinase PhoR
VTRKELSVEIVVEPEVSRIYTHPRALEYVLRNLVENAIKYTPSGGEIEIRAELRKKGRFRLSVQDTGIGIEQQHLPRLFERFYRVDAGRSRSEGGTGLGLAIVKHYVSALGGDVKVYSEPGKGSQFAIRLPREAWVLPEEI